VLAYETRVKIDDLRKKFENMKQLFNAEEQQEKLAAYEKIMSDPNTWSDQKKASEISRKVQRIKKISGEIKEIESKFEDIEIGLELSENDPEMVESVEQLVSEIEKKLKTFQLDMILNDPLDSNNAYLSIHPGAGGTESHDWAQMLLRMYLRWAEKNGYQTEIIEYQPGEEAGVKSVTVLVKGEYAYGNLKHERGVHRLVRISPFDASRRRHTSFASVNVIPEISDDVSVDIRPEDLRIDTFRASGHGGQYVNRTDSAVRITHLPTGIVVSCQSERSQHQNKARAMSVLRARLYQLELQKRREKLDEIQGELKDISWGNQIRSYVLHPYTMVKDHRTNVETGNFQAVLDGEIDNFIESELLHFANMHL